MPTRDEGLLLIAAAERADGTFERTRDDAELPDRFTDRRSLGRRVDERPDRAPPPERRQRDVFSQRQIGQYSFLLALVADEAQSRSCGIGWMAHRQSFAAHGDRAGVRAQVPSEQTSDFV